MSDRFFDQDKNYLLKEAQTILKPALLKLAVEEVKSVFLLVENPMGLIDDLILSIQEEKRPDTEILDEFYDLLAAVYRLIHGNNQLEFLWDGSSHLEHYQNEWKRTFIKWMRLLSNQKAFRRVVIKACILQKNQRHPMLKPHLMRCLFQQFEVTVDKNKNLVKAA